MIVDWHTNAVGLAPDGYHVGTIRRQMRTRR